MRRALLLLTGLSTLLGVLAAPGPASAAGPVVSWPAITAFNPAQTSYDVTVTDGEGEGVLLAWWAGTPTPVATSGTTEIEFSTPGTGPVLLTRCPSAETTWEGYCTPVSESPVLQVYDRFLVDGFDVLPDNGPVAAGPAKARIAVNPAPPAGTTATWSLVDDAVTPARTLSSGSTALVPEAGTGLLRTSFTVPAGVRPGRYQLLITVVADTEAFGHLEGTSVVGLTVLVDTVAPTLRVHSSSDVVYPYRDRYGDQAVIDFSASESGTRTLEVLDSRKRVIHRSGPAEVWDGQRESVRWNGYVAGGRMAPEGSYTMRLSLVDPAGNTTSTTRPVRVSHLQRKVVTYRRTVSASASLVNKSVGRCSTLARKSRGALLFASQARCRDEAQSVVATNHGIYVPRALTANGYRSLRITLRGGAASAARDDYLVMGYLRGKRFMNRREFHGGSVHRGSRVTSPSRYVFDRTKDKPYVLWSTGLTSGSRYLVRSFTVELTYETLVRPGRKKRVVAGTPQQTSVSPRAASSYSS
ncbi:MULTISPECIES: hypothetical protein [unclassified Nocardioides]|uniref:hypothetical protein n=1 Tax=unclassified Nocardioides TaxID=2615069 RepID=UPI0030144AC3